MVRVMRISAHGAADGEDRDASGDGDDKDEVEEKHL